MVVAVVFAVSCPLSADAITIRVPSCAIGVLLLLWLLAVVVAVVDCCGGSEIRVDGRWGGRWRTTATATASGSILLRKRMPMLLKL